VRLARDEGIPLTARGGGSGTAGAALGRGIVMAFPKRGELNRITDFQGADGGPRVTVQPSVVHDDLQDFLRERGLFLPADPSSGAISVLGGNVATKASGPHALKHGSIDRYVESVQFVSADGDLVDTADESTVPDRIREGVRRLREDLLGDAKAVQRLEARQGMKTASGYNLFAVLREEALGRLAAQLLVGSVGTLGVLVRATLRAEPYVEGRATTLLYFRSLDEAADAAAEIKDHDVDAVEIMNHRSIEMVRRRRRGLDAPEDPSHMLLVEYSGPQRHDAIGGVLRLLEENRYALAREPRTVEGAEEQAEVWAIRKALLPTVRGYSKEHKALSVVNDVGVDTRRLADLIRDVEALFDRLGLQAAIYGHAGSGNLHLRPLFDREAPDLPALIERVADEVYAAVFRYGGTITAEHGMGPLRAPYLAREWGDRLFDYMHRVKDIFDPEGVLNPGAMFPARPLTEDLKPV
jgi:FAD/FMN-containing dehydrogenase